MLAENSPKRFQNETLTMVSNLVETTAAVFSLLSPQMKFRSIVTHNMNVESQMSYHSDFFDLDPLNPENFRRGKATVVSLSEVMPERELLRSQFYDKCLRKMRYRYVSDMFLRNNGRIVAIISLLRAEKLGDFSTEELERLRTIQPFVQFTLNEVYSPRDMAERQSIAEKFAVTEREVDVIELAVFGASTKQIARDLGVSPATVKTHLQNIFRKTNVASRAELISLVNFENRPLTRP